MNVFTESRKEEKIMYFKSDMYREIRIVRIEIDIELYL